MIKKIETARITALDGYAEIQLEECSDGVLNIKAIEYEKQKIRIGIPEKDGVHFKFLSDYKTPQEPLPWEGKLEEILNEYGQLHEIDCAGKQENYPDPCNCSLRELAERVSRTYCPPSAPAQCEHDKGKYWEDPSDKRGVLKKAFPDIERKTCPFCPQDDYLSALERVAESAKKCSNKDEWHTDRFGCWEELRRSVDALTKIKKRGV